MGRCPQCGERVTQTSPNRLEGDYPLQSPIRAGRRVHAHSATKVFSDRPHQEKLPPVIETLRDFVRLYSLSGPFPIHLDSARNQPVTEGSNHQSKRDLLSIYYPISVENEPELGK